MEGIQSQSTIVPYLVGGALASATTINLLPERKRAYVELAYRNQVGILQSTEGHWISVGKSNTIEVNNLSDGWVDVTVTAPPKQGLRIQQIELVSNSTAILFDKTSRNLLVDHTLYRNMIDSPIADFHRGSVISSVHSGIDIENRNIPHMSKKDTVYANALGSGGETENGGSQPNQLPSDCPDCPSYDGGWLPELVVVGHYTGDGGGSLGQNWAGFLAGFQTSTPDNPAYYTTGGSSNNGNDTYVSPMQSPPGRSLIQTRGMRRASFCNSLEDLWDWSYGNNNTNNTVEQAAFILGDGTMLMLLSLPPLVSQF